MPFILTIIDPCPTTTLVLNSPFIDVTYVLGDPTKVITWASDIELGAVAISPTSCGNFEVTFWILDAALNPVQDVTTLTSPVLTVDQINRVFSVI